MRWHSISHNVAADELHSDHAVRQYDTVHRQGRNTKMQTLHTFVAKHHGGTEIIVVCAKHISRLSSAWNREGANGTISMILEMRSRHASYCDYCEFMQGKFPYRLIDLHKSGLICIDPQDHL